MSGRERSSEEETGSEVDTMMERRRGERSMERGGEIDE